MSKNPPSLTPEAPWRGILAYQEGDGDYFFGREAKCDRVVGMICRSRVSVLYGVSGCGKTSFVRALLMAQLREAGLWPLIMPKLSFGKGKDTPLDSCVKTVCQAVSGVAERAPAHRGFWELFRSAGFHEMHEAAKDREGGETDRPLVLIFDQFEEVYRLGEDKGELERGQAEALFQSISDHAENHAVPQAMRGSRDGRRSPSRPAPPLVEASFLFVQREDYLHRLERHVRRLPSLRYARIELECFTAEQAVDAIYQPGLLRGAPPILGRKHAQDLVSFVAAAAEAKAPSQLKAKSPGIAPGMPVRDLAILSHLCQRLNDKRLEAAEQTIQQDKKNSRPEKLLLDHYQSVFLNGEEDFRHFLEDYLLARDGSRESRQLNGLLQAWGEKSATRQPTRNPSAILAALEKNSLVAHPQRGEDIHVEFIHDQVAAIIADHRANRMLRRRIREQRRWTWLVAAACLAVGAIVGTIFYLKYKALATEKALGKVAEGYLSMEENPEEALRLALDSTTQSETEEARRLLAESLPKVRWRRQFLAKDASPPFYTTALYGGSYGEWLCLGRNDGYLEIWDAREDRQVFKPHRVLPAGDRINSAITSLDVDAQNRWLAVGGADGTALVFSLSYRDDGLPELDPPFQLEVDEGNVVSCRFNSAQASVTFVTDQKRAFVFGGDKFRRLGDPLAWEDQAIETFASRKGNLTGFVFKDATIGWAKGGGLPPLTRSSLLTAGCDVSGRYLVLGTSGGVDIRNSDDGRPAPFLSATGLRVSRIAFYPNGRSFLAGCDDGRVQIWRLTEIADKQQVWREVGRFRAGNLPIVSLTVTPLETSVVVVDKRGAANRFALDPIAGQALKIGTPGEFSCFAYHPGKVLTGRKRGSQGEDHVASPGRVSGAEEDSHELVSFPLSNPNSDQAGPRFGSAASDLRFSRNGRFFIAVAGRSVSIGKQEGNQAQKHEMSVEIVRGDIADDGQTCLLADASGEVLHGRLSNGARGFSRLPTRSRARITDLAISPDGTKGVFACSNGEVVWRDFSTGDSQIISNHPSGASRVIFGKKSQVISGGSDGSVHLFDFKDRKSISVFAPAASGADSESSRPVSAPVSALFHEASSGKIAVGLRNGWAACGEARHDGMTFWFKLGQTEITGIAFAKEANGKEVLLLSGGGGVLQTIPTSWTELHDQAGKRVRRRDPLKTAPLPANPGD